MPIYMDVHNDVAITPEELAALHMSDLAAQDEFEVHYLKYWFNASARKVYCLVDAPSADAAVAVHRSAHGGQVVSSAGLLTGLLADRCRRAAGHLNELVPERSKCATAEEMLVLQVVEQRRQGAARRPEY